jgi:hypothetical protein
MAYPCWSVGSLRSQTAEPTARLSAAAGRFAVSSGAKAVGSDP